MRVTFLGTAAAEAIPALWCECETCRKAFQLQGKDLRKRSAFLIDTDTLVDYGPDIYTECLDNHIYLPEIKRIVFTHAHSDHLNAADFHWRRTPAYSWVKHSLKIYGSPTIFTKIIREVSSDNKVFELSELQIEPVVTVEGKIYKDGDFELLPLKANHAYPGYTPQVHVIGKNGKYVFIANDTGFLPDESWEALKGKKLDLVEIDSTMGLSSPDHNRGHQGVNSVVLFRDRLIELGCITPETPVYANHFSHNGHGLHADYEAFYNPRGIQVAYDGLTVEV